MSWFYNLCDVVGIRTDCAVDAKRDTELTPALPELERAPILTTADWQAIKVNLQAEVRALVPKTIVESIYSAGSSGPPDEQNFLLQAAANRLFANVSYEILCTGVAPPFEPNEEILTWSQEALEDSLRVWQQKDRGVEDGDYKPPVDDEQSTTRAILDALRRASANDVLYAAAKKRVQAKAAMVAAE